MSVSNKRSPARTTARVRRPNSGGRPLVPSDHCRRQAQAHLWEIQSGGQQELPGVQKAAGKHDPQRVPEGKADAVFAHLIFGQKKTAHRNPFHTVLHLHTDTQYSLGVRGPVGGRKIFAFGG